MSYKLCTRCQFVVPEKKKICTTCGGKSFQYFGEEQPDEEVSMAPPSRLNTGGHPAQFSNLSSFAPPAGSSAALRAKFSMVEEEELPSVWWEETWSRVRQIFK